MTIKLRELFNIFRPQQPQYLRIRHPYIIPCVDRDHKGLPVVLFQSCNRFPCDGLVRSGFDMFKSAKATSDSGFIATGSSVPVDGFPGWYRPNSSQVCHRSANTELIDRNSGAKKNFDRINGPRGNLWIIFHSSFAFQNSSYKSTV